MYVLGIETSCDETAASVVKNGREVLAHIVASSLPFHKRYRGIVPEIAFRKQLETIASVTDSCLRQANLQLRDLGLVSVTDGPGLLGSLLVGISFAKALSISSGARLLGINHLHSHIYGSFLQAQRTQKPAALPFVALVVSGGHTSLFFVKDFDSIGLLGATLDDACGEAFDKVAKILGLGYPGGPIIEKLARKGDPRKIKFACSNTKRPLDFSFSGIKTAVLYYVSRFAGPSTSLGMVRGMVSPSTRFTRSGRMVSLSNQSLSNHSPVRRLKSDIAASFQESVIDVLIQKSFLACELKKVKRLVFGGGVVANKRLRGRFLQEARKRGVEIFFPQAEFCLDNAGMVAGLGYQLFRKGHYSDLYLSAKTGYSAG